MHFVTLAASVGAIAVVIAIAAEQVAGWWVVGVFVLAEAAVYQCFSGIVRRRRRDLALLRCFGASRGQVFTGVLTEAAWVGFFGTVVGFGVAFALGVGSPEVVLFSVAVGVGGAMIGALVPALRASRVPPAGARGW
jgi:ABC-type lipoprotein release transport system permease subunit